MASVECVQRVGLKELLAATMKFWEDNVETFNKLLHSGRSILATKDPTVVPISTHLNAVEAR